MQQLQEKFDHLKTKMTVQEKVIEELLIKKEKNLELLNAFRNEKSEMLATIKKQQEKGETLTADQYVEARNASTGLKARIEYHEAYNDDLENSIYDEKESLLNLRREAAIIRSELAERMAKQKFTDFCQKHNSELQEIFNLFCITNNYGGYIRSLDHYEPVSKAVKDHLRNLFDEVFENNYSVPEPLSIHSSYLDDFEEIRPTKKHKERLIKTETGLKALIDNLTA